MPYIQYTPEQKTYANSINLVDFLQRQGEKLKKAGNEYRWVSGYDSVTIKENKWHRHSVKEGGYPISFCMEFLNMKYQDAMNTLLDGVMSFSREQLRQQIQTDIKPRSPTEEKNFELPQKNGDMKRAYAYLIRERGIDTDIINHFVKAKKIYEEGAHHNIVFVGHDENDKPRYAHQKGTVTFGESFRGDVKNSDKQYGFNFRGTSNKLYVFEAPIDMLSFISMNKNDWQQHNYLALGGVADNALLHFLRQNEEISHITLCLDNDNAGIEAMAKILVPLYQMGKDVDIRLSKHNDWNDELKQGTENAPDFSLYKGERKSIYVFNDSMDMISYMSMRQYAENIVKDNPSRNNQVWHKDSYFSLDNIFGNSLAYYLKQNDDIKDVKFFCGYGRNEEQAQQIFESFDKYYNWAVNKGYEVDFKLASGGTWDKDLKEMLATPPEAIKEAFTPKQETPSIGMKL